MMGQTCFPWVLQQVTIPGKAARAPRATPSMLLSRFLESQVSHPLVCIHMMAGAAYERCASRWLQQAAIAELPRCFAATARFSRAPHTSLSYCMQLKLLSVHAGSAQAKSASAPAAPLLASAVEHGASGKSEAHGVSRSSPDTPLSDRLKGSFVAVGSRDNSSDSANTATGAKATSGKASHADGASYSASGSLSDRSINLCFTGGSPSPACGAIPSPMYLAAASGSAAAAQRAVQGPLASSAAVLGPSTAFQDGKGGHRKSA